MLLAKILSFPWICYLGCYVGEQKNNNLSWSNKASSSWYSYSKSGAFVCGRWILSIDCDEEKRIGVMIPEILCSNSKQFAVFRNFIFESRSQEKVCSSISRLCRPIVFPNLTSFILFQAISYVTKCVVSQKKVTCLIEWMMMNKWNVFQHRKFNGWQIYLAASDTMWVHICRTIQC